MCYSSTPETLRVLQLYEPEGTKFAHFPELKKNDSNYDAFTLKDVNVVAVDGLAIDATAVNLGGLKRLISHPWRTGYFQRPYGVSGSSSRRRLKGPWPGWLKARRPVLLAWLTKSARMHVPTSFYLHSIGLARTYSTTIVHRRLGVDG